MSHFDDELVRLYDTVFDRAPDAEGLNFWIGVSHQGYDLDDIATWFISSPECAGTYGVPDNRVFVHNLYQNILDRQGEASGGGTLGGPS